MDLTFEKKEDIPEGSTDNFVEFKEGDKTVFMHKDLAESKKQAFRLQGDLTTQKGDIANLKTKLTDFESQKKQALDKEEEKRLDKLKSNNQHDEIIDDLRAKVIALETENLDIDAKWSNRYNGTKKDVLVAELSNYATDSSKNELKRLISQDISFDDSGNPVIIGDDGKATATTLEDYKMLIASGEKYPSLIKAVSSQGGKANGSGGTGSESAAQFGAKIKGFSSLPKN